MSQKIEDRLSKIPILNWIVKFLKKFKLPGFEGLSTYDLLEMYVIGVFKGALDDVIVYPAHGAAIM